MSEVPDQAEKTIKMMKTEETRTSTVANCPSEDEEEHTPVNLPAWQSKPNFPTKDSSEEEEEEEEEEDSDVDEIDAQLRVVLESLRDLYRESEGLCKKVFSKFQHDDHYYLSSKKKMKKNNKQNTELEGQEDNTKRREAFVRLGNKKISRILKQEVKWKEEKTGVLQRSLSFDSPRTPPERFKIKTFEIGGGGGWGSQDVKGSSTTTESHH